MHPPSPGCLVSQVRHKGTVPGALCVSSGKLISGCDTPGRCDLSRIPERCGLWLAACSVWWEMWSWGRDCSGPLPSASGCRTPASLPPGREDRKWQKACSPLVFPRAQACQVSLCQLEPSCRKGSVFFFVYLAVLWLGLLCPFSPLRLSSGHSSPVLIIRTNDAAHTSTPSPYLLHADTITWAVSLQ